MVDHYALKSGIRVSYRPFRTGDAKRVSKLLLANFAPLQEEFGQAKWDQEIGQVYKAEHIPKIAGKRNYHVVAIGKRIVGVVGFINYSKVSGEVSNLSVDPIFQGKGLGTLLVILSMRQKIGEGVSHFLAYAGQQSRGIFLMLGFQEKRTLPKSEYGDGMLPLETRDVDLLRIKGERMLSELTFI